MLEVQWSVFRQYGFTDLKSGPNLGTRHRLNLENNQVTKSQLCNI